MADFVLFALVVTGLVYVLAVVVAVVDVAFTALWRWLRGAPRDPPCRFPP